MGEAHGDCGWSARQVRRVAIQQYIIKILVKDGEGLQTAYAKKSRKSEDHRFSSGCRLGLWVRGPKAVSARF